MPVVWYLYIFFICQLFVYLEAKMSTNWHFWRLLKMQTNSCIFVNKHHKNFLLGYFFIPYVYLNFDRKKNLEVHGMSRYLRHLQLICKVILQNVGTKGNSISNPTWNLDMNVFPAKIWIFKFIFCLKETIEMITFKFKEVR